MHVKLLVGLAYKDVFDDYETTNLKTLLQGIPYKNSLKIIGHFLAQIHANEQNTEHQLKHLELWVNRIPTQYINRVGQFILMIRRTSNTEFNFLNNISLLRLIERVLENRNELPVVSDLTPQQELSLLKAYLFCAEEWQSLAVPRNVDNSKTIDNYVRLLLPSQLPERELIEFKDFRIQLVKAWYFFTFCEKSQIFQTFLQVFLQENGVSNWEDFLRNSIGAYIRDLNPPIPSILKVGVENNDFKIWLDNYCLDPNIFKRTNDFQSIRDKPLFKIGEGEYLFLSLNFFIDKMFQGIPFDFAKALISRKIEYNGKPIKSFVNDFKPIYSEVFSEKGLFYEALNNTFSKKKYLMLTGDEVKKYIPIGPPDFYMRQSAKVYLFEFKDVLFNAASKYSYDFETIKSELFRKMVENDRGSDKGVTQIVNSIKKLVNNEFTVFDDFDFKKAIVYPILVYSDINFDTPGINYLLEKEFESQIETNRLSGKVEIKPLVMVDIDTLIKFQDLFRTNKLTLNHCLNGYIEFVSLSDNKLFTFSQYMHNITLKMPDYTPKLLMEIARKLLPNKDK